MATRQPRLEDTLARFGVPPSTVRILTGGASPDLIEYLDLVEPRGTGSGENLKPDAVAEVQGRPLLFFVDESSPASDWMTQETKFEELSRKLACRGDEVHLARVKPGELHVQKVSILSRQPNWRTYDANSNEAITFFSRLANGLDPDDAPHRSVFKGMLQLLTKSADMLAKKMERADVLSLTGRALFFRFLIDREVVKASDLANISRESRSLHDCFDNAKSSHQTCEWLDRTFNGNFLPLSNGGSSSFFAKIAREAPEIFSQLSSIIQGREASGQHKFSWAVFDFAHVPIGLLSQVYEAFCWKWEHTAAKGTSVHYTPRHLAEILVDEAFDHLDAAKDAKVLDCACGAGVFLTLAFRRLYQERWIATGSRPDTKEIRAILERQLTGFDISDSALKLASLSLYLTAIELDPNPVPPEKLRFNDLMGSVLFNHRRDGEPSDKPVLGSLGPHLSPRFDRQYDLILSNPPWTSFPTEFNAPLTSVCRKILERADEPQQANTYLNPDIEPDLPFVFRSTEWCKVGGRIAMVLPARILLKQGEIPKLARETLFRLVQVSGIINGANLSDTDVWPDMNQPFMLFFATNRKTKGDHNIRFITPQYDHRLIHTSYLAIDSKSARPLRLSETTEFPWIWKAHSIGTSLDIEVTRRLLEANPTPLNRYWKRTLGLVSGKGFQDAPEQIQRPAPFMRKYLELTDESNFKFVVDPSKLKNSKRREACWPRNERIYKGPLVLIRESPGEDRNMGRAILSLGDLLYNESYTGYSAATSVDGELLSKYIHLFVHSSLWMHFALMISPQFGAERRRIHKEDIDACPIVPLEKLSNEQRSRILALSKRLVSNDSGVFTEIDEFFGELFGLEDLELEVIADTLEVSLPFDASRARAWTPPNTDEQKRFRQRLLMVLKPFFKAIGKSPRATNWQLSPPTATQGANPYTSLLITDGSNSSPDMEHGLHSLVLRLGEDSGATRVIEKIDGGLFVSILNQYRYWTPSRARLLGIEIVRRYMNVFEG